MLRHPGTPDTSDSGGTVDDTVQSRIPDRGMSRRSVVAGLSALLLAPGGPFAPAGAFAAVGDGGWDMATQIVAGTRVADPNVQTMAVDALVAEVGSDTVRRLHAEILKRDAHDIVEPFEDPDIEAAARRFVEMVYTGSFTAGSTVAFHQALAWQVLPFTKPPSVCGPGMGWWHDPPARG